MNREERGNIESKTCPECDSELAVETRRFNGTAVTVAVCTNYPDCNYFYWTQVDEDNPGADFDALSEWAIKQSLDILHDELPPREWQEALTSLERFPEESGGDDGG